MDKNLISIIVPVYNSQEYLPKCVDSILSQSYANLELILIDDGSTDTSPIICDHYKEKDKRVRVVHKKNAGPSCARNEGLRLANGDYIGFVDSDDHIDENMYDILLNHALKNNSDIAMCSYKILENGEADFTDVMGNGNGEEQVMKGKDIANRFLLGQIPNKLLPKSESYIKILKKYQGIPNAVWNKLYKADVIDGTKFEEEIKFGEDLLFTYDVLSNADSISSIQKKLYYYSKTSTGISRNINFDSMLDIDMCNRKLEEMIKHKNNQSFLSENVISFNRAWVLYQTCALFSFTEEINQFITNKTDEIRNLNRDSYQNLIFPRVNSLVKVSIINKRLTRFIGKILLKYIARRRS